MATSGIGDTGSDNIKICLADCVSSIRVQVHFSGIKKEELDVSGKILKIKGMKVPMTRFGSWVFLTANLETEALKALVESGGPTVAFAWALHKLYPEISAWLDDASNCSFTLECENQQKSQISNEIGGGKMKEKMEAVLLKMNDPNLKIKLIKILPAKPLVSAKDQPSVPKANVSSPKTKSKKQSSNPNQQSVSEEQTAQGSWEYIKLKSELDATTDKKERLKKLTEFAICSFKAGKLSQNPKVVDEMKQLMQEVKASQDNIKKIHQNIREFSKMLHDNGKPLESIDILLSSAKFVANIKNAEERVDAVNSDLKKVGEMIAKIYKIKTNCIEFAVKIDDELGRGRPDQGSGTAYGHASKAQQNGKRAFRKHQYDEALHCYETAIKYQPKEMLYRLDKAEVFLAQGEYDKCKEMCGEGENLVTTETSPKNQARIYDLLGEAEERSYHPLKALVHFRKSLKIKQTHDAEVRINLLNSAFQQAFADGQNNMSIRMAQMTGLFQRGLQMNMPLDIADPLDE